MRALITGITGQDGAYLSKHLQGLGYDVYGLAPARAHETTHRLRKLETHPTLLPGDLTDPGSLQRALVMADPDEVYNLGALTFVGESWNQPQSYMAVNGMGVANLLESIRQVAPETKVYQASTSEMYGNEKAPQSEQTPFSPRSPYGAAKLYAHALCRNYRESYGMHISCGILFNHESPLRGPEFVTQKVCTAAREIAAGKRDTLLMGALEPRRDWGFAGDYVKAMHAMLQQPEGGDYVVATGETRSVLDLVEAAFDVVGLRWHQYYEQDPRFLRPAEVNHLCGDASKARDVLGWVPETSFGELVEMMVHG